MALNLEKQLEFYGQYHHTPVNKAIHIVCVPIILMTGFLLATNSPTLLAVPKSLELPNLPLNLGTLMTIIYAAFYVLLEPVAGSLLAPILLGGTAVSNYLTLHHGSTANAWGACLFVLSWIAQFVGHGVFEGRAPALMDNLVQALLLAPFFVWMEILFFFGYRQDLKARVEKAVKADIAAFRKRNNAKQKRKPAS